MKNKLGLLSIILAATPFIIRYLIELFNYRLPSSIFYFGSLIFYITGLSLGIIGMQRDKSDIRNGIGIIANSILLILFIMFQWG